MNSENFHDLEVKILKVMASGPHQPLGDGRYEIRNPEPLGEGHFGEVFDGWDTMFDVRVAIKLFEEGFAPDQAIIEAQLQHRLSDHPNVVNILNVVPDPPRPFAVMEFINGGSVADRLDEDDLSVVNALRWTRDGLSGLGHAHNLGIVHRDFKPGNLLVLDNGGAALSDFGLAEDMARAISASQGYEYFPHAAPELETSGSSVATDIWAAGCTLYRLLTGEYPFEDEDARDHGDFERPHRLNPQVPMKLTRAVEGALELDPAARFSSASEMEAEIAACGVRFAWMEIDNPDAVETWSSTTNTGQYTLSVIERPRSGPEVVITCDKGSGPRRIANERQTSLARARQIARSWLVAIGRDGKL